MIAKNKKLIIRYICNSSLQFSLQSDKLSANGASPNRMHSSLQTQWFVQMGCKEKEPQYQLFMNFSLAGSFAYNSNLK